MQKAWKIDLVPVTATTTIFMVSGTNFKEYAKAIIEYPNMTIKIRCFLITWAGGVFSSTVKIDLKMTVVKELSPVEIVDKVALYGIFYLV